MKRLVLLLSFGVFFMSSNFVLASDFKGLYYPLLGKKVEITEDNRPNGTAAGKIGTVTEIKRADWIIFDLKSRSMEQAKGNLPPGCKEWDPGSEKPKNQIKLAVLLGHPVITLEDDTKILNDDYNVFFEFTDKDEEKKFVGKFNFTLTTLKVATKQKPPTLPEPKFKIMSDLGITDFKWPLKTLDDKVFNFNSAKGKVVFINIWATWCGPCLLEMPSLQKLYDQMKKSGVVFLFVTEENKITVKQWLKKNKSFSIPIYLTKSEDMPILFKTEGIPATFIVARSGSVVFGHIGAAKWDGEKTIDFLRMLGTTPAKPVKK